MEEKPKNVEGMLKWIIVIILCFVIVLIIFIAGVFVGQEKAKYSFIWAENYHRNFGGPVDGFFGNFSDAGFTSAHGIFGQVLKISGNSILIKGQDNIEKMVIVSGETEIINQSGKALLSQIKMGSSIVVIGYPDEYGSVKARLIRVLPATKEAPLSYCNLQMLR